MKKITILCALLLVANLVSAQTIFGWETAVDNGENTTETIEGITVTLTGDATGLSIISGGGFGDSSGNVSLSGNTTLQTFTFNQPLDVQSILPLEAQGGNIDYTLTPTGGSNSIVVVSLTGGTPPSNASVVLNWTNVTSFTVTATPFAAFAFDNLSVSVSSPSPTQTIFGWETAVDNGDNTTETIDGITVTLTGDATAGLSIISGGGFGGSSGNVSLSGTVTLNTFTFNQPLDVQSILPLEAQGKDKDYTLTPTGGSNSIVVVSLTGGTPPSNAPVVLNWTNVTSFTVTATSLTSFAFDNLSVNASGALSVTDDYTFQKAKVYPNPVVNILHVKNISGLKIINIYNSLGQQVLQSKQDTIDVSHLSKGMYFLQIESSQGTETKRIIKK